VFEPVARPGRVLVDYGREVEEEIARLQALIEETPALKERWSPRWLAVKLLEGDSDIIAKLQGLAGGPAVISRAEGSIKHLRRVYTNRILGLPIFLVLMWIVFEMTANVSGAYLDWVDGVIGGPLTRWVVALLGLVNLGGTWVESLVVDGIIAGVGGVLVFVPVLLFLYSTLRIRKKGRLRRARVVGRDS